MQLKCNKSLSLFMAMFMIISTMIFIPSISSAEADSVMVSNITELQDAIDGASSDMIIELAEGFNFEECVITNSDYNIAIKGNSSYWNNGNITILGISKGSITIEDLFIVEDESVNAIDVIGDVSLYLKKVFVVSDESEAADDFSEIEYNANGGYFNLNLMSGYDGAKYYEVIDDKIDEYFSIGRIGEEEIILDENLDLSLERDSYEFKTWNTMADGSGIDYSSGEEISFVEDGMVLYAIWEGDYADRFEINYHGNESTSGSAPVDDEMYLEGETVSVKGVGDLIKSGYDFKGWSTESGASSADYVEGDIIKIESNLNLYAVWDLSSYDLSWLIWNWGDEEVEEISNEQGLHIAYMSGYPNGTINPSGSITRGEVAAIVARLSENTEDIEYSSATDFADVNSSDWYAKYIAYVVDNGLMEGYEDGSFNPNTNITRAEYAAVVARYNNLSAVPSTFEDVIGHWAEEYIGAIYIENWIEGYPDGTFMPGENISREEVATMTNKMLGRGISVESILDIEINKFIDLNANSWSYYDMIEASNTHVYTVEDSVEQWVYVN